MNSARRHPAVTVVAVVAVAAVLAVGALLAGGLLAGHRRSLPSSVPAATSVPANRTRASTRTGGRSPTAELRPVAPLLASVPDTPIETATDRQLASGLAASGTIQTAEASTIPPPGYIGGWGPLPVASTPDAWVQTYLAGLLDIDFASQDRTGLGWWVVAQGAPELLPGVPAAAQNKISYLSIFEPAVVGGGVSPIPAATTWRRLAHHEVRWQVGDLLIETDPTWARLVAAGWQPPDARFAVEDVSGLLSVTAPHTRTERHRFSVQVYVGSAHWHPGYGTVLVTSWKET